MSVKLAREALTAPDRYDPKGYKRPVSDRCTRECMCVVLDLDETLVRTFRPSDKISKEIKAHKDYYKFTIAGETFEGIKRPYLDEFMKLIYRISNPVIVFTAATRNYADEIIKAIFPKDKQPFDIFSYEDCTGEQVIKPIDLIFKKHGDFIDENRLIILDDRESAYYPRDQENLALIPKFVGDLDDDALKNAKDMILHIRNSKSVVEDENGSEELKASSVYDFDIKNHLFKFVDEQY